jgi:hypothetical protein
MLGFESYPGPVQHYRHLRTCARTLQEKVFGAAQGLGFSLVEAARKLGLPMNGRTLIFDSDSDMDALMDFFLHDFQPRGRRLADGYEALRAVLSREEGALLRAHCEGRASLFEMTGHDERAGEIYFKDILYLEQPETTLIDIHLSGGARTGDLFFCRVLNCEGISFSSGNFFVFRPEHKAVLLDGHARVVASRPEQKRAEAQFIYFFQQHRFRGTPRAYAEVISAVR